VCAACGSDDGGDDGANADAADTTPDAMTGDVDASPPDASPTGTVSITVVASGVLVPGIDVVFNDPSGAVVSHQQTNVAGAATEMLAAGSSLTIAIANGNDRVAVTYAAVEPGDELVFELVPATPAAYGDVSVEFPPAVIVGAASYEVRFGCTTLATPTPVAITGELTANCLGSDQNIDAIALVLDASGTPLGYDYVKDVPGVAGGTTAIVFDAWQQATTPLAVTLTNAPINTFAAALEGHWRVDEVDFLGLSSGGQPTGGTITMPSAYPTGFAERLTYNVFVGFGTISVPVGFAAILGGHSGTPGTVTHDLALLPPQISDAAADDSGGRAQLSWTAAGSLAATDGALVAMAWTTGALAHQRVAVLPPDAASPFVFPALPDALMDFRPTSSSTFDVPTVIFADADYIDGYDAWRDGGGFMLLGNPLDAIPATGGVLRATIGGQLPGG
jgi:hypothetical protein